jgi:hypothetical protein
VHYNTIGRAVGTGREESVSLQDLTPIIEEYRILTCKTEGNASSILRFNDAGELESITEESGE